MAFRMDLLKGKGAKTLIDCACKGAGGASSPDHIEIVGKSNAIKEVIEKVELVAPTEARVLITGETGTGKNHEYNKDYNNIYKWQSFRTAGLR